MRIRLEGNWFNQTVCRSYEVNASCSVGDFGGSIKHSWVSVKGDDLCRKLTINYIYQR